MKDKLSAQALLKSASRATRFLAGRFARLAIQDIRQSAQRALQLAISVCLLALWLPIPSQTQTVITEPELRASLHAEQKLLTAPSRGISGFAENTPPKLSSGHQELTFVENKGQFDSQVKFQVSASQRALWLTQNGIVFDFQRCNSIGAAALQADLQKPSNLGQKAPLSVRRPPVCGMERHVISQDFLGANKPVMEPRRVQPGQRNYLMGSDPTKWQTQVRGFSEVLYHDVWQGVDIRLYGKGANLEQEFIVNPGADLKQVQVAYKGIERLEVRKDGSLLIRAVGGEMRESRPRIYQEIGGQRVAVKGRFRALSATSYTFDIPAHNEKYPLVIDPTLLYSTFLGGSAGNNVFTTGTREAATGIAVDQSGNAYVTGFTQSPDFPTTPGAFQITSAGGQQTFVSKLSPAGSTLIYSTYLSASFPTSIAVDQLGNAYVAGSNAHPGFATTTNAYSQSCDVNGGSAFLTVLNLDGSNLIYSTCFGSNAPNGGAPVVSSMATDAQGHAYVAGLVGLGSTLPTTPNAYQPAYPGSLASGFVTEFDTTLSGATSLVYSTYLGIPGPFDGGHHGTTASAVAVDSFGKIYLTGFTADGFPVTPGAFQTLHAPCIPNGSLCPPSTNAFIVKLDPTVPGQQSLIYATYLGGIGGVITNAIAVDFSGAAYVTGSTDGHSTALPITPGAFQSTAGSASFVTKFNPSGSQLVYSTFVGDLRSSSGNAIAVDAFGNAYIVGQVNGGTFPVTPDAFQNAYAGPTTDFGDAFVSKVNPTGSALIYSTYFGGTGDDGATALAIDQIGDVYIAGHTSSFNLPVTGNAFQPAMDGAGDAFVAKFPLSTNQTLSLSSLTPSVGGNAGSVSPQIFGSGIHAGATAQLNCSSAIPGTNLTVGPGGRFFSTTFNLMGTPAGTCDVVVTNSDGTSATLPQAFTVQQGGAHNIQVYLTGVAVRQAPPEVALAPSKAAVLLSVRNTGTEDASAILIASELRSGFSLTAVEPEGSSNVSKMAATGVASWSVPVLGPGQSVVLAYFGTTALSPAFAPIATGPAWGLPGLPPPRFPRPFPLKPLPLPLGPSLEDMLSCIEDNVEEGENDGGNCQDAAEKCGEAAAACEDSNAQASDECADALAECAVAAAKCSLTQACLPTGSPGGGSDCLQISSAPAGGGGATGCAEIITPTDPNNIAGPTGLGDPRWVGGTQPLAYLISFGNESNATAPAQTVIVTQPLGPNVDLSTLSLPVLTIPNGSGALVVPLSRGPFNPSLSRDEFSTNVDLRPTQKLLVSVDALLNPNTQTLTWTFTSIDPTTGQSPVNPLIGFLPPGAGANVSFSVTPKQGLTTGSRIAEQATITFLGADPLSTQVWTNSLDNAAPISQVTALPSTQSPSGFTLTWSGTDVGSGIQDFTIFVSDNGGPFTPFQTNTTATSATFAGQVGHTYGFYSIARDLVGNVEANKTSAEATTQVALVSDSTPPITSALAAPAPNAAGWNNSNVTVSLSSADDPGGTGVKQITFSSTGAQPIASTTVAAPLTSFSISTEGISTVTFFGTDNAGNAESPKMVTVRLDKTPPSITDARTPAPNANGWNNSDVTVSFSCADALSGLAPGSPPANTVISAEGVNQKVSGACQDLAGNTASATLTGINIDKTAPTISGMPAAGCVFTETGKLIQIATVSGSDALSGLASLNVLVTSSQTSDDVGEPDIVVTGSGLQPRTVQIRTKIRNGAASRTFTINSTAMDAAGNLVNAISTCTVTKSH